MRDSEGVVLEQCAKSIFEASVHSSYLCAEASRTAMSGRMCRHSPGFLLAVEFAMNTHVTTDTSFGKSAQPWSYGFLESYGRGGFQKSWFV
jgi:hypothetical protein